MNWIWVFLGGGLGSVCRFAIAKFVQDAGGSFPWATLIANMLSCVILGLGLGLLLRSDSTSSIKFFWMIGFCGGFSTFSTFTAEVFTLLQDGNYILAAANIFGSVLVCLLALFIGIKLAGA